MKWKFRDFYRWDWRLKLEEFFPTGEYSYLKIPCVSVFDRNPSMSWCWDSGCNHWAEKGVPINDTLLKFACITSITTAYMTMQACVISSLPMSSYVADGVLWRLVVLDLLLCIWAEPDKLVTQWRGRLFLNCCEETPPKKIFQDYVVDSRPLNPPSYHHSLSNDLAEIWMIWFIQRQLGFDIAQFILERKAWRIML